MITQLMFKNALREMDEEIESLTKRIEDYDREIAARDAIGDGETQKQRELRETIDRIKTIQRNLKDKSSVAQRSIPQLENEVKESDIALNRAQQRLRDFGDQIRDVQGRHDNLSQQRTDPLVAFGPHVRHILRRIQNAQWDRQPLGPIGQYVKLKDMRYKQIAESVLSRTLCGFVVTTQRDMNRLSEICRQVVGPNRYANSLPLVPR